MREERFSSYKSERIKNVSRNLVQKSVNTYKSLLGVMNSNSTFNLTDDELHEILSNNLLLYIADNNHL